MRRSTSESRPSDSHDDDVPVSLVPFLSIYKVKDVYDIRFVATQLMKYRNGHINI